MLLYNSFGFVLVISHRVFASVFVIFLLFVLLFGVKDGRSRSRDTS